jgi:hypothetical protein
MRSLLGVSLVLIGLVACGGGVSVSTNASNVCSEVAEVACHNLYQCCSEGEIEDFLNVSEPRTEPQCKEDVRRLCERNIVKLDTAIEAKRVKFESETMNKCLEALVAPSDTCAIVGTMLPWTEECMDSAWVGLVADGGQCFATNECASKNSICATNQTCTPRPVAGEPCGQFGCAPGNFCQTGICRAQLGTGQACTSSLQCIQPLFCDFAATGTPVCTDRLDGGAACSSNQNCKSGQCIPGTCAGSTISCFTAASCNQRCADDGGFCGTDFDCGSGRCSISTTTFCSSTASCPLGETCNFPVKCLIGASCVGTPACTTAQQVADYCEDALGVIGSITP